MIQILYWKYLFQHVPSRKVISLMVACKKQVMIISNYYLKCSICFLNLLYWTGTQHLPCQLFENCHMSTSSKHILHQSIFQKGIGSSGAMEVFALKSLLTFLTVNCGIRIRVLVTDRSTSVRTMLAKDFPAIDHQFDIW